MKRMPPSSQVVSGIPGGVTLSNRPPMRSPPSNTVIFGRPPALPNADGLLSRISRHAAYTPETPPPTMATSRISFPLLFDMIVHFDGDCRGLTSWEELRRN